jgi:GT2 family glycosyltransferase
MTHVCAVLTCFNRREATLRSLACLEFAAKQAGITLSAVLVDDGSTDGSSQAVESTFDWVHVIPGGDLYWNRGMRRGLAVATSRGGADFVLWLNDDTNLRPTALRQLLDTHHALRTRLGREVIVVGAAADEANGHVTYSGRARGSLLRPLQFSIVYDPNTPSPCDTMNGNIVLVPMAVALDVGNLDDTFEHSMGDIDYGLRARMKGHPIYVAPGIAGYCSQNSLIGTHLDSALSFRQRWNRITSRKELPPRSWFILTSRHGGILWPIHFVWPYLKVLIVGLPLLPRSMRRGA